MSVYCTWLSLDDGEPLGKPYIYQGSHVVPNARNARGGSLDFASVPNHLHPKASRTRDDARFPVEFARLSVHEDDRTYDHEHVLQDGATVILERKQVTALRDTLTQWLESKERW